MKLHCPTCNRAVDISHASRYKVFACACGRKFRGIHAEECLADYLFWKFAGPTMRLFTFGLAGRIDTNKLNYTRCPYCDAEIGISYSSEFLGVTGPSHCWACTNKLPTDPVNNLGGSLPVTPPAKPTEKAATSAIPQEDRSITEMLKIGRQKIARGEYDRAVDIFSEAIRLDSECVEAYFGRACAYFDKGYVRRDFAHAIPDLVMTLRLNPSHQEAQERLAEAKKNLP